MTDAPAAKANERPLFRLVLRPEPNVAEPDRALRRLLKLALRKCGLRCISCEEVQPRLLASSGFQRERPFL